MKSIDNIILKVVGILLLAAAVLKGGQLLTEPLANNDIWSNRIFLIVVVECEMALGIWLLSGLFKKAAWLVSLVCFALFSFITLYKGISGAASCGCFGSMHVNPWITLAVIDIPACLALGVTHPRLSLPKDRKSITAFVRHALAPAPSLPRFTVMAAASLVILAVTGGVLALNEPAKVTGGYEVLEPLTWIDQSLPILDQIDIGEQLKQGLWLVLFYHYDCPDCGRAIRDYQRVTANRAADNNKKSPNIAFIEVPPYGRSVTRNDSTCTVGKLSNIKEWFMTTPAVVLLENGIVRSAWDSEAPAWDAVLKSVATFDRPFTPLGPIRKEVMPTSKNGLLVPAQVYPQRFRGAGSCRRP